MLKHVSFLTRRPDEVLAFYTRLGGQLLKDSTAQDGLRRMVIEFQNSGKLQFFAPPPPIPDPAQLTGSSWMEHVALEVPDLLSCAEALKKAGVTFSREMQRTPSGKLVVFVLDPDGRQVELLQQEP
ncbi:VOC family protein [Deinococcus peraridilitoris]|uniref:Lactoylglutathione lyase-like lyase n=1 Tax=Deinococcus peraridilitoris (strain DSM 19664 / LMG 22246 / CIP 109416 / KR-200) TaxID=937777 RepID=L0A4V8_DEIPD|nr:VOC family protein [Deinococcus peraridilitoris]AFZ68469.1 lactoylglutathione lyase-like lyase [Deinococcus peraridilitoris DSM 19664]